MNLFNLKRFTKKNMFVLNSSDLADLMHDEFAVVVDASDSKARGETLVSLIVIDASRVNDRTLKNLISQKREEDEKILKSKKKRKKSS